MNLAAEEEEGGREVRGVGAGGPSSGKRRWPGKGSGRGDASVICLLYKIHMRMFGWLILVFVRQRRRVPGE